MTSPSQNPFQLDGVNGSVAAALTSVSGDELSLFATLLVSAVIQELEVLQRSSRLVIKLSMEAKSVKRCSLMSSKAEASSKDAIIDKRG
ncbi:hypothetical protein NC653_009301 [Populus alba x Populus x berolinensis]|uniref:Uncharacterized protein n=1 Tax=Populus alba x Populus x berolinensis TaxID=444605 RepID=A0AAD6W9I2_9ROSI|nr:hypothetical protein NC653_009301 [Populus alba x Populus x berolinensis]